MASKMTPQAKKKVVKNSAIMAIVLALVIVASALATRYGDWLDTWLGRGAQKTTSASGLDANYIDFKAKTNEEAREMLRRMRQTQKFREASIVKSQINTYQ